MSEICFQIYRIKQYQNKRITIKNIFLDDSLQYNSLRNPVHYLLYCVEATLWGTNISELVQFNVVKYCLLFLQVRQYIHSVNGVNVLMFLQVRQYIHSVNGVNVLMFLQVRQYIHSVNGVNVLRNNYT
jgi:type II secretory pathway component HofQ